MSMLDDRLHALEAEDHAVEDVRLRRFNLFMGTVVVLNILAIAVEMDFGPEDEDRPALGWILLESAFIVTFIVEIGIRIWWEGKNWPRVAWNWFDVIVVAAAIVDVWILSLIQSESGAGMNSLTILRISRLVRLVRMVKLVRMLSGLYIMVVAFWHALQSMFFLGIMMIFGILIYSIFAVTLIGRNDSFDEVRIGRDHETVYDRFGTVSRAMYSLFEIMTLEGWEEVSRPLVTKQPLTFLFIGSFILIFTFGMLNMIVALVVQKTLEQTSRVDEHAQKEARRQIEEELRMMKKLFVKRASEDGSRSTNGTSPSSSTHVAELESRNITPEQFEQALKENDALRKQVLGIGVHPTEAKELFTVLDWDQSGEVTVRELMDGLAKLQAGAPSPWDAMATHASVRHVQRRVEELQQAVIALAAKQAENQARLESRITEQAQALQDAVACLCSGTSSPSRKDQTATSTGAANSAFGSRDPSG